MSILYGLAILKTKDTQASVLYSLYNMEGIRLYQYHTMKEFITFGFCEIAERCEADKKNGGDYVQAPKQIQELDMLFKHFSSQENTKLSKAEMLQTELDETNEQMEILVSDLVERGENIEDKSKDFFVKAKKSRRCHFCGLF
ncbi:V-SNARE coiled-coil-like proteiny domain-containing protein [Entamoeba marina]